MAATATATGSSPPTAAHWTRTRWHGLGHIHRERVPLHGSSEDASAILRLSLRHEYSLEARHEAMAPA